MSEILYDYILNKKHYQFRKDLPEYANLNVSFSKENLSPKERMTRRFELLTKAETPILLPDEKIAFMRTVKCIPDCFTRDEWIEFKHNRHIHEWGYLNNLCPDYETAIRVGLLELKKTADEYGQRSIHDGPGGRITVFLKGCPLRCVWCHNPEGLSVKPQLLHKKNLCSECGLCKRECNHPECKEFQRCVNACPNGANTLSGKEISADELADKLKSNRDFLIMTGGGITVSGGEPLMQADFVCELADKLGDMHKAIQTSGYSDNETYKRVIDKFDFVMQDIKLADSNKHKKFTGVGNEKILENIEYLKNSGKEFVFRVPLIPEITDTAENLTAISEIVGNSPVELLKYNALAGAKYEMLGMNYALDCEKNRKENFNKYFKNSIMR